MRHFSISFTYLGNNHQAYVQKIRSQPVQFTVYNVYPAISGLPEQIVFFSNPDSDQLICESFDTKYKDVINVIGSTIFITCAVQKIAIHH